MRPRVGSMYVLCNHYLLKIKTLISSYRNCTQQARR